MINRGIKESLNGGGKFLVSLPEDILHRERGKSLNQKRSVSRITRCSSQRSAYLSKPFRRLPKFSDERFGYTSRKNRGIEKTPRNIFISHPSSGERASIGPDQIMKKEDAGHQGNRLFGGRSKSDEGELNLIGFGEKGEGDFPPILLFLITCSRLSCPFLQIHPPDR